MEIQVRTVCVPDYVNMRDTVNIVTTNGQTIASGLTPAQAVNFMHSHQNSMMWVN